MPADHNELDPHVNLPDLLHKGDPIIPRHADIHNDDIRFEAEIREGTIGKKYLPLNKGFTPLFPFDTMRLSESAW